jgi:hypothetical protein
MITLELANTPSHRFDLQESVRQFRGKSIGPAPAKQLESWVELSEVASVTFTEDLITEDKKLVPFFNAHKDKFRFDYIRFGCTFRPRKSEVFNQAWLAISLEREHSRPNGGLVVWSMVPEKQYDTTTVSTKATIGAKLKFITAEVDSGRIRSEKDYFIRAYREGRGAPFWEFTGTRSEPINGSYLLHMIVRSNTNNVIQGKVELTATIEQKKFFVIPSVKDFEDKPVRDFRLPFTAQQAPTIQFVKD